MKTIVSKQASVRQDQPVTPARDRESQRVTRDEDTQGNDVTPAPLVRLLRIAIDELHWKHEALAEVLEMPSGRYLSGVLSGEKPLTARHLNKLPIEIQRYIVIKAAERLGLICIAPQDEATALRAVMTGVLSLLPRCVPAKAEIEPRPMLKVG